MTNYIPEQVYGLIPGTYGEYGLIPWPAHMKPVANATTASSTTAQTKASESGTVATATGPDVELTKKGEAYVAAALAESDRVVFVTVDKSDRQSISTTIERLINMLDDLSPDPDPGGRYL